MIGFQMTVYHNYTIRSRARRWIDVVLENGYKACVWYRGKPLFCMEIKVVHRHDPFMKEFVGANRFLDKHTQHP
jgi:hypothetical protein